MIIIPTRTDDLLANLSKVEVAIAGTTTLTTAAFGRMHNVAGTTADYTITLPAVSGNTGKLIGFRFLGSAALTKTITLSGNGSEQIRAPTGTALTRIYVANEAVLLYCSGSDWHILWEASTDVLSKHVTGLADTRLPNALVIPGLNGSADIAGVGGAGVSYEFNAGDTNPFTWNSSPANEDIGVTAASHHYMRVNDATERFAYVSRSMGNTFDVIAKMLVGLDGDPGASGGGGSSGIFVSDTTMTGASAASIMILHYPGSDRKWYVVAYNLVSGTWTLLGNTWNVTGNQIYLIIRRSGGNWQPGFSSNGRLWQFITAPFSYTMTQARFGFRVSGVTAYSLYHLVDFLRTSI